jgi:uncharacterized protein YkwD
MAIKRPNKVADQAYRMSAGRAEPAAPGDMGEVPGDRRQQNVYDAPSACTRWPTLNRGVLLAVFASMRARRAAFIALSAVLAAFSAVLPYSFLPTVSHAIANCSGPRSDLTPDVEEKAMLQRINDYRSQFGLAQLSVSPALTAAAAWKSNDLGTNGYFAHDDGFRTWTQRLIDCGYVETPAVEETLAAGNADAAGTFEQWRTSPDHNANMLDGSMRAIGVARARVSGSPFGWYWTSEFGSVSDASPATPAAAAAPAAPAAAAPSPAAIPTSASLISGAPALVTGTGLNDCLKVHDGPSLSAGLVACLPDGSAMVVTGGPVSADGYTWWRLGDLGWAVGAYLIAWSP